MRQRSCATLSKSVADPSRHFQLISGRNGLNGLLNRGVLRVLAPIEFLKLTEIKGYGLSEYLTAEPRMSGYKTNTHWLLEI